MPMHPVTSTLMYRGMCAIPDMLYTTPVSLPEDEVEGEMYLLVGTRSGSELFVFLKISIQNLQLPRLGTRSLSTQTSWIRRFYSVST